MLLDVLGCTRTTITVPASVKPARSVEEQTVEGVRNAEDGTEQARGRLREWTPPVDVAMRDGSPWEVLGSAGRAVTRETLEGRKAQERMNPSRKPWGTAAGGTPRGRLGNDERRGGIR